ncbi:uncharacterized protein ATNIH1004_011773 [Aspergillus tanneri]|uniref:Uncharacterized protein n=1 Tax=Aspergillus tanneri TaxID=1220188 RepID=A0A5M9MF87_9EURO|nr:uncharacterized protein ATNIH1004_011773 [Aspergillus tanneri]KAA8641637.1 hypothetical protein ATNIH1004_011773 [Aspergillus tanneri]
MAGFYFCGQKLNDELVTSISRLLNTAGVPALLWGNYLLTIYGVPTIVDVSTFATKAIMEITLNFEQGVAFVVPDALTEVSYSALSRAGFLTCTRNSDCPHQTSSRCPPPTRHLHIDDELTVSLYRKSDVLWELPEFGLVPHGKSPDIMYASDTQLPSASLGHGRGRFNSPLSPVRIPTALRYCEALILLLCRDRGSIYEAYWMAILTYMLEYVDGTPILDEKDMRDGCRHFYQALKSGDSKMYVLLDRLRYDLNTRQNITVEKTYQARVI